jgi:hypothetical protein
MRFTRVGERDSERRGARPGARSAGCPTGVGEQTAQTLLNITATLGTVGASLDEVATTVAAATVVTVIPPAAITSGFQRYIASGLAAGSLK